MALFLFGGVAHDICIFCLGGSSSGAATSGDVYRNSLYHVPRRRLEHKRSIYLHFIGLSLLIVFSSFGIILAEQ